MDVLGVRAVTLAVFAVVHLCLVLDHRSFLAGLDSAILHTEFLRSGNHGRE